MPKKSDKKTEAKSGSARKPAKITLSADEFKARVLAMAGTGLTAEKIGEILRREGIHTKEHGVKISVILKSKGLWVVPELKNTEVKLAAIVAHYEKNHQDKRSMREKDRIFSELRKIKAYHKVA